MPSDCPVSDRERGLYDKFRLERLDGKSAAGEKHDGCEYFVLDLTHDPHAIDALIAYAESCAEGYPVLSSDLNRKAQLLMQIALEDDREATDAE